MNNLRKIKVTEKNDIVTLRGCGLLASTAAHEIAREVAEEFGLPSTHNERDAKIHGADTWEVAHRAIVKINGRSYLRAA